MVATRGVAVSRVVVLAILVLALVAGGARALLMPLPVDPAARIWIIDGDTVEVAGVRYRLVGLDAPEIFHSRCPAERERGLRAAVRLMALVEERGGEVEDGGRRERWGRRLGRLWLGRGEAREDWAAVAERAGLAAPWSGRGPKPGWCGEK